jgi:RNA polymerase sigma-70 factor, ECF subfamily
MARELEDLTTGELVVAATEAADQQEFGNVVATLMLRFKSLVYAQALHLCRADRSLADDVFQETFLRVFQFLRNREGRPPVHSFAGLLRLVARRAAIDMLRSHRRDQTTSLEGLQLEGVATDDSTHDLDAALYARQLMDGLEPRQRDVLSLTFFEGLTTREAAARLGIKANYVRQLKFRALAQIKLRHALDEAAQLLEPV